MIAALLAFLFGGDGIWIPPLVSEIWTLMVALGIIKNNKKDNKFIKLQEKEQKVS